MPFARASELDRLLACHGSLVLPRDETKSDRAREAAAWGTMAHLWKATGEVRADPEWPSHARLFHDRLDRTATQREDWWPPGAHEVGVGVDSETGATDTATEDVDAWKEARPETWVVGTTDYRGTLFGEPWVDDLKTGKPEYVVDPADSNQLRLYALAVGGGAPTWGSVTLWPRYPKDGRPWRLLHRYERDDLARFLARLKTTRALAWLNRGRPPEKIVGLTTGPQCLYCPSRGICPELKDASEEQERSKENDGPGRQEAQVRGQEHLQSLRAPHQGRRVVRGRG